MVVSIGIDPIKVMEYTPYELTLLAKRKAKENQEIFESNICLAWHIEAFARQKRLPKLDKIIRDSRRPRKGTITKGDILLKRMAAEKGVIIK